MGTSSPSWWLECAVVLSHSGPNMLGQYSRDGGARRQKTNSSSLCGTELLLSVHFGHIISESLRGILRWTFISHSGPWEWAGAVLLGMKPWTQNRFFTSVPAMWGGWQEWKAPLLTTSSFQNEWLWTPELLCWWVWVRFSSTLVSLSHLHLSGQCKFLPIAAGGTRFAVFPTPADTASWALIYQRHQQQ